MPKLEGPGSTIGPYRLLQSIGEGGFGTVFLAEQSEPVRRQVALKIVKLGMDTAEVVARFEQERQALAVMDHPHIAKVFDAGSTATGRPYFVMELCRGEPLTDYCDKNHLTIDERLALFEQICHAVQHAHGKGIIHRDLKPSNVLVGGQDGMPHAKVIDFGIAKATQRLTDRTLFTEAQQVVGTLQYMSPEQAEGSLDIDTRTDVYALGVILYELLTGSTPFDHRTMKKAVLNEVLRQIREVEPHKPSTRIGDTREKLATIAAQRRVEPKRLPALVRGELDWIAMKAIEKDRTRRYATALGLAQDIARFRKGEPVEAAPPSASYRLKKLLRRHRGSFAAAALVFVALLAGMAGTLWGMLEAQKQEQLAAQRADAEALERRRADGERDRAVRYRNQALNALRATTGEDVEKLIGSRTELTQRERDYLEAIARRWLAFSQKAGADVESRELRAEGLGRVAQLRGAFGDASRVRAELEEAIATWESLHDEFPNEAHYEEELVRERINLAILLYNLGDDEGSAAQYGTAREHASRLAERFPDVPSYRFLLATTYGGLGLQLLESGQHATARRELQTAIDIEQRLVAASPDSVIYLRALAHTRGNLAKLLKNVGEHELALGEFEATRALHRDLATRAPDDTVLRSEAANSLQNVAIVLGELGQLDRAKREYRTAIDEFERLAADFPAIADHQSNLARTRTRFGSVLADLGEHDAARIEYNTARERQEALVARDPAAFGYQSDLASTEYRLAMLAANRGDADEAIELFQLARDRRQRVVAARPADLEYQIALADTLNQLGIALIGAKRVEDAEAALADGRDLSQRLVAAHADHDDIEVVLGNVRNTLGLLYKQQGRREEARVELEAARDARRRVAERSPKVPRYQVMLGGSHCNVGNLLLDGDPAASLPSFDAAVAVLQAVHEREHRDALAQQFLRNSLMGRGRASSALQRWAEAAADWERCTELSAPNEREWYERQRALALVRSGAITDALAGADAVAMARSDADAKAFAARVYALAAGADADPDADRRQQHGDSAMALLQEAVAAGLPEPSKLGADADFAALAEREDFRRLVEGR